MLQLRTFGHLNQNIGDEQFVHCVGCHPHRKFPNVQTCLLCKTAPHQQGARHLPHKELHVLPIAVGDGKHPLDKGAQSVAAQSPQQIAPSAAGGKVLCKSLSSTRTTTQNDVCNNRDA